MRRTRVRVSFSTITSERFSFRFFLCLQSILLSANVALHLFSSIVKVEGHIDLLVNNAGYGSYGAIEDVSIEEARKQFDVNVFGVAMFTKKVLPYMRDRHNGTIINVASIGGRLTTYGGAWYHATKYALEAFSDALRMETKAFGVQVSIIEPGEILMSIRRLCGVVKAKMNNAGHLHTRGKGCFRCVSAKNERGGALLAISVPRLAKFDQFAEEGDALQQGAVADDQHAFARTGQRHIEFAVYPLPALVFKLRVAEEG